MGIFITVEGIDGCGKTTQVQMLCDTLKARGYNVFRTREPGGCKLSEQLRETLLDPKNADMTPVTEALLYAAARTQHVETVILPELNNNKIVVSDRYIDSSVAYQGYARGLGKDFVLGLNAYALSLCTPHITIFLDCDVELMRHEGADRLEINGDDFFTDVRRGFLELCETTPRICRIVATGSIEEIHTKIMAYVEKILE